MGTLLKVAVFVVVVVVVGFELGSPTVVRLQLDDTAQNAADAAGRTLAGSGTPATAQAEATEIVTGDDAQLTKFAVNSEGLVEITVADTAPSYLLDRIGSFKKWYDVEVDATSSSGAT